MVVGAGVNVTVAVATEEVQPPSVAVTEKTVAPVIGPAGEEKSAEFVTRLAGLQE